MRTKTLLIAAATLAIGIAGSQAQSTVYSQNVVGYVNKSITGGQFVLLANPLNNGTNDLATLLPNAPLGSTVYVWTGTTYEGANMTPSGWSTNFLIPPGEGFFVNLNGSTMTNTFVGNVAVPAGSSITNTLPVGFSLVGSPLPYADTLSGTNLNLQLPLGSTVYVWNGTTYEGANMTPSGWSTNLTILPGQGFFVVLNSSSPTNWVQNFAPSQ